MRQEDSSSLVSTRPLPHPPSQKIQSYLEQGHWWGQAPPDSLAREVNADREREALLRTQNVKMFETHTHTHTHALHTGERDEAADTATTGAGKGENWVIGGGRERARRGGKTARTRNKRAAILKTIDLDPTRLPND